MTKKIECPNGHPAPDWASPGDTITCPYCATRYSVEAPARQAAPESFVSIKVGGNVTANRIVAGDLNETHYHDGVAPAEAAVPPTCPKCRVEITAGPKFGREIVCACGVTLKWGLDDDAHYFLKLVSKTAVDEGGGNGDLIGKGQGVNIDAGDGDVDVPGDVVGGFKIGD